MYRSLDDIQVPRTWTEPGTKPGKMTEIICASKEPTRQAEWLARRSQILDMGLVPSWMRSRHAPQWAFTDQRGRSESS